MADRAPVGPRRMVRMDPMSGGDDKRSPCAESATVYRYTVTGVWGEVPDWLARLADEDDCYLLYDEHRGDWFQQDFCRRSEIVGGWVCDYHDAHHYDGAQA